MEKRSKKESETGFSVKNETSPLRRVLIHSPDRGVGKVIPSKALDWLFEDIVHLDTMRRKEYDLYVMLLLWFLDPEKIRGRTHALLTEPDRSFFKPGSDHFYSSSKVLELEVLLADIVKDENIKQRLTSSVAGIERCSYQTQEYLNKLDPIELSRVLISGTLPDGRMLFSPLPNLIFTRDLGVVINQHLLLSKAATSVRARESLLTQYIFYNHPYFTQCKSVILELPENGQTFLQSDDKFSSDLHRATLEGGDLMMVAPGHLLMGNSERTSLYAVHQTVELLFEQHIVDKVTVLKIPKKRDYMHLDTIVTQVKKNAWVLLRSLGRHHDRRQQNDILHHFAAKQLEEQLEILQFKRGATNPFRFDNLEDLLEDISRNELGCTEPVQFIYSGKGEFPYSDREQWTDSCNVLALRDGVVLGYDRNDRTLEAFREAGFEVMGAEELLRAFEEDFKKPEELNDMIVTIPSAELSRARGGFHCMSLPLERENV